MSDRPTATARRYDVVALPFPIVYTKDGDHDPDGLLYTLEVYRPLLEWARARWDDDDQALPALHRRRQLAQLVVDGLWRYDEMLARLADGPEADRHLVHDLGGPDDVEARGGTEHRVVSLETGPRHAEVRQNFLACVDEVVAALDELTHGTVDRIDPDPVVRQTWRARWQDALHRLDEQVEQRLVAVDQRLDDLLQNGCGDPRLTPDRIGRLLLNDHRRDVAGLGDLAPRYDRFNPMRPVPLVRPLVLRARHGETVDVHFRNEVSARTLDSHRVVGTDRHVGLHRQGAGLGGTFADGADPERSGAGVRFGDGAHVGRNPSTVVPPGGRHVYRWACPHEGVWPFNDLGDVRGTERGSNVHGLFGALVVEPAGATWSDPETGEDLTDSAFPDGLHVDVHLSAVTATTTAYVDLYRTPSHHREFTVFIHDEPEIHSGFHVAGGEHTVMPLSYRAEPMPNRLPHRMRRYAERTPAEPPADAPEVDQTAVHVEIDETLAEVFRTARTRDGRWLDRVAGEEQHHSSWLFGEPVTPVLRAYKGDPARIRLVHAGVKETHVFHLHVHQWRAVPQDGAQASEWREGEPRGSQLLDSVTIGPQTGVTIDPLYGSGSRQHAPGDIIWHCHLYPHFHHGMWGLWRSFDRLVDGSRAYPDGTPCAPLRPLPGRRPKRPTPAVPGFPWFIDATFPQKSPPPPAVVDAHVVGRRRHLRMPAHSAAELAAFAPGAVRKKRPGALFVDLDGLAVAWNAAAGLPPPRVVRYDVEVRQTPVAYNSDGWHDPHGHHYRITAVTVTPLDARGRLGTPVAHEPVPHDVEPFFPRANHGDVVELFFHNELGTIPADHFDLTTPPVECGLHVHLVKFDVLAADGSSTGWNYLAGASCREAVDPDDGPGRPAPNVGLHRWVVDEEFGPCFFHDHLLANYRQKHGLFAALVAEPHGSQWFRPDQETVAWSGPEAVVVTPGQDDGDFTAFREACLAVGDFVPLHDEHADPLNPPRELGGDEDPGSMGVNYRSAPLTFRGDDPSQWFSSASGHGDPDTPVVTTYAGERLRLRLVQGSHEEQHSFVANGLRWRKEWHHGASTLVDQQTIGISEAFTLDLDPATGCGVGPGDHLWRFAALDDTWLGCWGLVRALGPGETDPAVPPLPDARGTAGPPADVPVTPPRPHRLPDGAWSAPVREFVVVAQRTEHQHDGRRLTDPWGLVYRLAEGFEDVPDEPGRPRGRRRATGVPAVAEPLVLRARPGEWVRVTLVNEVLTGPRTDPLLPPFGPETNPPRLPLEALDDLGEPAGRTVTPRVSLHASLLRYDVTSDDGSNVGRNRDGTAGTLAVPADLGGHGHDAAVVFRDAHGAPGAGGHVGGGGDLNWREYWWYADAGLAPDDHTSGPGTVCFLRDLADVRNHQHHGLVGALVVEPGDVRPVDPGTLRERWSGAAALLVAWSAVPGEDGTYGRADVVVNEQVLVVQDGLRLFAAGNPDQPVRDTVAGDDPEDAGQKAVSYRTALVHPRTMLADPSPPTPVWQAREGERLWLRLVCAADKPRNHTFTVHGLDWPAAPWLAASPYVGALSGLTAGGAHTLDLGVAEPGDHAYRSGAFRWAVEQGLWGILRVEPDGGG